MQCDERDPKGPWFAEVEITNTTLLCCGVGAGGERRWPAVWGENFGRSALLRRAEVHFLRTQEQLATT